MDPLETACFPLVPYANRIAHGRFAFRGRMVRLARNFGMHPHSLHGLGWQSRWEIAEVGDAHVVLAHRYGGEGDWPWAYRAEQRFALTGDGLEVALTLTNSGDEPMPAGLGLHPCFPVQPETRLTFRAAAMWLADADMLRTESAPPDHFADWTRGARIAGHGLIDNAFEGWDGAARLDGLAITARGADALHLYVPPGQGYCCIEPVSHLPDAFNRDLPADALAPGAAWTLTMRLAPMA
jgi:aldose 1-epimerase